MYLTIFAAESQAFFRRTSPKKNPRYRWSYNNRAFGDLSRILAGKTAKKFLQKDFQRPITFAL